MALIPCEVCGSKNHHFLFEGRDRVFGVPGRFNLVQCKDCGLIFINPQPDQKDLKAYYPKEYYASDPSHYREYSLLRRAVLEAYFGYDTSSRPSLCRRFSGKCVLFPFRVKYRHSIPFVKEGRILDIGCGNGTELYKLKGMGWKTHGVEIARVSSAHCRFLG